MARPKKDATVVEIKSRKPRAKKEAGVIFDWETIDVFSNQVTSHVTRRAWIPEGWLVEVILEKINQPSIVSLQVIADPKHKFVIQKAFTTPAPTPQAATTAPQAA